MVYPVQNRGRGRDGFGSGRQGRGLGRTAGRGNVWQRVDDGRNSDSYGREREAPVDPISTDHNEIAKTPEDIAGEEEATKMQNTANWDQAANQYQGPPTTEIRGKNSRWDNSEGNKDGKSQAESSKTAERRDNFRTGDRGEHNSGCRICGLRNHNSEDCCHKTQCEICGYNNHSTYECKRGPLWNDGPELCAAQVEDQSFFYIEEIKDQRAISEKASTAIITVLEGQATARQIEEEFKNTVSSKVWRWSARAIAENKFTMRFPDANMVLVYSNFKCLGMKKANAQILVEPWNSAVGAKGELQQAWFRVRGIPTDQRSIRTIAKIGGLVGKTLEIDEKSRNRSDYVRVKIACRDVLRVPVSAESTLGMNIYDFFFEREIHDESQPEERKVGVQIEDPSEQPYHKKMRTEGAAPPPSTSVKDGGRMYAEKGETYKKHTVQYSSARAKIYGANLKDNKTSNTRGNMEEKSYEESEESDNFSLGINGSGYTELQEGESSKGNIEIGLSQCSNISKATKMIINELRNSPFKKDTLLADMEKVGVKSKRWGLVIENEKDFNSLKENFIPAEGTVKHMSQAFLEEIVELPGSEMNNKVEEQPPSNLESCKVAPREDRRTSSRLNKDILLTTEEKNMKMGRKRNLEGTNLNSENSFAVLSDNDIMHLSRDMGVILEDSNFTAIDLIKDLEIARHSLRDKTLLPANNTIAEEVIIEELEEELSDIESERDSMVVLTSKRKTKPKQRLSLSGPRQKKKNKENPCSKKAKEDSQGILDPPLVEAKKKGKKMKCLFWNCRGIKKKVSLPSSKISFLNINSTSLACKRQCRKI